MKALVYVCLLLLIASFAYAEKIPYRYCESCLDIDDMLAPNDAWQTVSGSTIGQPNGEYAYGFCAVALGTYTFSFCQQGGTADYDTALSIQGPDVCGAYLACNDDWCSLQSEIVWVAPADGNYIVVVDGFSSNEGNYTLAYAGPGCLTPTEETNWGTVKSLY